jgi:lysozyme
MTAEEFEDMLIRHEGLELRPYKDTVGKVTIGVGRNLDDRGITEEEAIYLMRNDIEIHAKELADHYPIVRDLDDVRYYVLVNMAFNLGLVRLSKFKKMWGAITTGDYVTASEEMLNSKWATQVGNRAIELSRLMKTGKYEG